MVLIVSGRHVINGRHCGGRGPIRVMMIVAVATMSTTATTTGRTMRNCMVVRVFVGGIFGRWCVR